MTLVQDDDVVDHRYNSYIECAPSVPETRRWRAVERFRDGVAPRRDAGENVAELEDDIAAALTDIERLAEESELYFQRSQEKRSTSSRR